MSLVHKKMLKFNKFVKSGRRSIQYVGAGGEPLELEDYMVDMTVDVKGFGKMLLKNVLVAKTERVNTTMLVGRYDMVRLGVTVDFGSKTVSLGIGPMKDIKFDMGKSTDRELIGQSNVQFEQNPWGTFHVRTIFESNCNQKQFCSKTISTKNNFDRKQSNRPIKTSDQKKTNYRICEKSKKPPKGFGKESRNFGKFNKAKKKKSNSPDGSAGGKRKPPGVDTWVNHRRVLDTSEKPKRKKRARQKKNAGGEKNRQGVNTWKNPPEKGNHQGFCPLNNIPGRIHRRNTEKNPSTSETKKKSRKDYKKKSKDYKKKTPSRVGKTSAVKTKEVAEKNSYQICYKKKKARKKSQKLQREPQVVQAERGLPQAEPKRLTVGEYQSDFLTNFERLQSICERKELEWRRKICLFLGRKFTYFEKVKQKDKGKETCL